MLCSRRLALSIDYKYYILLPSAYRDGGNSANGAVTLSVNKRTAMLNRCSHNVGIAHGSARQRPRPLATRARHCVAPPRF